MLSYLLLRGRCSNCQTPISMRYPWWRRQPACSARRVLHFGATPAALAALVLLGGLVALTVIDLDEQLLPDQLTLPLLWLGLLVNIDGLFTDLSSAVIGAAAGYLSLWLCSRCFA